MQTSVDHFELLKQEVPALEAISSAPGEVGYFAQEALRFYSIAGTLRENDMLKNASAGERQISHILGRSLLEGFFWLIYLFDDQAQRPARFQEKLMHLDGSTESSGTNLWCLKSKSWNLPMRAGLHYPARRT